MSVAVESSASGLLGWWGAGSVQARRALVAATLGWMLDAFDVTLFAMTLPAVRVSLGLSATAAGVLGIRHARRRRRRRSGVWLDCGSIRPHPRADAQRHRLLGVYRGVRARAGFPAAPGRPRASRVRHGRGVGEWRRARVRELGRRASRKGARPDAERMGGWLRGRGARQRTHPTGLWLARGVLRRNPPGLSHDLDSSARGGTAHLAVAGGRQDRSIRHPPPVRATAGASHDRVDLHERLHAVRMVGLLPVAPELSRAACLPGRGRTPAAFELRLHPRDAVRHVGGLRDVRVRQRCAGAQTHLRRVLDHGRGNC